MIEWSPVNTAYEQNRNAPIGDNSAQPPWSKRVIQIILENNLLNNGYLYDMSSGT